MDFKYKTSFSSAIKVVTPSEKDKHLAIASLERLAPIFPDISISDNPSLLFVVGNAAVAGFVNLNDDGISIETALKITPKFKYGFIDIEHDRNRVVGSIFSHGYTEYGSNKIISESEAKESKEPFNMTLGGFIWTIVNPDLAELLIEASNEYSPKYGSISYSWELGFNDYVIGLGSKIISEAEIIDDPIEIEKYSKYLRVNGGSGKTEDGVPVYRIITGEPIPLGLGLVANPAASVKGVLVASEDNNEDIKEVEEKKEEIQKEEKNNNIEKNIANKQKESVKKNSIMKKISVASLEEITDDVLQDVSAASVREFIGEYLAKELDKVSTKYSDELKKKEDEAKAKEAEAISIQETLKEAEEKLKKIEAELAEEKEARIREKVQADFDSRMASLSASYDLSEKEFELIAKRIKGLDEDAYAEWLEEFSTFASAKKIGSKKDEKESKASAEDELEKLKNEDRTPGNSPSTEETVVSKFAGAFKVEDLIIK